MLSYNLNLTILTKWKKNLHGPVSCTTQHEHHRRDSHNPMKSKGASLINIPTNELRNININTLSTNKWLSAIYLCIKQQCLNHLCDWSCSTVYGFKWLYIHCFLSCCLQYILGKWKQWQYSNNNMMYTDFLKDWHLQNCTHKPHESVLFEGIGSETFRYNLTTSQIKTCFPKF